MEWILCDEMMPKARQSVLLSVNAKYGDWVGEGCYWETTENHVIWKGYRWNATYWDDEIIAWMPLPKPYKADRKTENCSVFPNNCDTCRFDDKYGDESICSTCARYYSDCYEPKDESQTKLCRECDDYAGDGMYCASNHIVYDFSTSKGNCEPHTERS